MKFLKIIVTFFAATILVGCASVGNEVLRAESESTVQGKIAEGKSTRSEIRGIFGSPLKTSFTDGGLEIWTYEFSNVSGDVVNYIPIVNLFGSSASGKKKELVILFNKKGVVQRFSMSESKVAQKDGLFNW